MNKKLMHKIFGFLFLLLGLSLLFTKLTISNNRSYILDMHEMSSQMILSVIILSGLLNLYLGYSNDDKSK